METTHFRPGSPSARTAIARFLECTTRPRQSIREESGAIHVNVRVNCYQSLGSPPTETDLHLEMAGRLPREISRGVLDVRSHHRLSARRGHMS